VGWMSTRWGVRRDGGFAEKLNTEMGVSTTAMQKERIVMCFESGSFGRVLLNK
jgi:hypothetical protein